MIVFHHYILGFEISVENTVFVHVGNRFQKLEHEFLNKRFTKLFISCFYQLI